MHSSTESAASPHTVRRSSASSAGGAIEAASTTAAACGPSCATRARTRSRTVAGTWFVAVREELGDVERVAGRELPGALDVDVDATRPASRATPSRERGRTQRRSTAAAAETSPSAMRRAWSRASWSSRYVTTTRHDVDTILRPSIRITSSVPSSAQCASSTTTTSCLGFGGALQKSGPRRVGTRSTRRGLPESPAPSFSAISRNGPSGRGVASASHPPQRTPFRPAARRRSDLPEPSCQPLPRLRRRRVALRPAAASLERRVELGRASGRARRERLSPVVREGHR